MDLPENIEDLPDPDSQLLTTPPVQVPGYDCVPLPYTPVPGQTFGNSCEVALSQPIVIEFDEPLGPGINEEPGTLASIDGTAISVDQVTAGRIGASVEIRSVEPFAAVTLIAGNQSFPMTTLGLACPYDSDSMFSYVTDARIPLDQGQLTLRIISHPDQQPSAMGVSGEMGACPRLNVTGE